MWACPTSHGSVPHNSGGLYVGFLHAQRADDGEPLLSIVHGPQRLREPGAARRRELLRIDAVVGFAALAEAGGVMLCAATHGYFRIIVYAPLDGIDCAAAPPAPSSDQRAPAK